MNRLIANLMVGCGFLIALLSGLCSLIIFFSGGSGDFGNLWDSLGVVLVFGGIPLLVGLGLFYGGWSMLKIERMREAAELRQHQDSTPTNMPDSDRR